MNNKLKKKIILTGIIILCGAIMVLSYLILSTQRPQQQISDTPLVCTNAATCEWDAVPDAALYEYKIIDTSTNLVLTEGTSPANTRSISFTPIPGRTYKCEVTVTNNCGSSTGEASALCPLPSTTPTLTPTPSTTPTLTPTLPPDITATNTPTPTKSPTPTVTKKLTPTPTRRPGVTATLTPTKSPTPTPTKSSTPTPTKSPTPTPTRVPTATPTNIPTVTASPSATMTPTIFVATNTPIPPIATSIPAQAVQPTPRPTIPPTGSIAQTIGMVSIVILTIIGGAIFFIL